MPVGFRTAVPLVLALAASPAHAATASLASPALAATARSVPPGGLLRVEAVSLGKARPAAVLRLERFEAFSGDARVVVHGPDGETQRPVPDNRYFRGGVEGLSGSRAVLSVLATNAVRGLVLHGGRLWVIAPDAAGTAAPRVSEVSRQALARERPWRCGSEALELPPPAPAAPGPSPARPAGVNWAANVAIETDYQFFQHFGDTGAELDYIADLVAYSSTIYAAQVDTSLLVGYVSLWTTAGDPWNAASTSQLLDQFRGYWIANHAGVVRSTAHMLSGAPLGGGIAYVGALCSNSFGYGVSADLDANFDPQSPSVVWDIVVVSHELGHNFSSPHTHCYAGYAGNPNPVDMCYSGETGCYSGPISLPGPSGAGSGTLMSYCHLIPPAYLGNMSLSLGLGHPYGSGPDRVPDRMRAYVAALAGANPACLALPVPVSVADAPPLPEGDSGTSNAAFTVSLAQPSPASVSVSYATADATAHAGSDYSAQGGSLSFAPGATSGQVLVPVQGDTAIEPDETFFLNLTGGSGVSIADGQGQASIVNDDFPALLLGDAAVVEGDAGSSDASFTAILSEPGLQPVTVAYATADGSATAGSDYTGQSGSLSFAPGTTSQAIDVPVLGDTVVESDETFLLHLSGPTGASIAAGQGVGFIADDDAASLSATELVHGSALAGDLGGAASAFFRIQQAPHRSYEVVVDALSGAMAPVILERLAADNATVLQVAAPLQAGGDSVSLRWSNPSPGPVAGQSLRLRSGGCGASCGASDSYRVRAWDTSLSLARFNNSATQLTLLLLQNSADAPVAGAIDYWDASGVLLASQPFAAAAHATRVINTASVPGLAGRSGSVSVAHDGRYGSLAGKAVAVEPATGFSFDTPLVPRPR